MYLVYIMGVLTHTTSLLNHLKPLLCYVISCRPRVDVHKGKGSGPCGQREGVKTLIICGRHKWIASRPTESEMHVLN